MMFNMMLALGIVSTVLAIAGVFGLVLSIARLMVMALWAGALCAALAVFGLLALEDLGVWF